MRKNVNIEFVRIISIFSVILIHIFSELAFRSYYEVYDCLFFQFLLKFSVPCFMIITGYLFKKHENYKEFWLKNLYRIIIPVILFSIFYYIFSDFLMNKLTFGETVSNISINYDFFKQIFFEDVLKTKSFHFWYIYDLLKLYLFYPLLQIVCFNKNSKKIIKYLIILLFITEIVLPFFNVLFVGLSFNNILLNFKDLYLLLYFLIGFYLKDNLKNINIKKIWFIMIYFVSIVFGILFHNNIGYKHDNSFLTAYSFHYNSIFVFFSSISIFLFFMKLNIKDSKIIKFLSSKTLIVYYIHLIFIYLFMYNDLFFKLKNLNFVIYAFVVGILSYIFSILCAFVFEKVKYLILKIINRKHQI